MVVDFQKSFFKHGIQHQAFIRVMNSMILYNFYLKHGSVHIFSFFVSYLIFLSCVCQASTTYLYNQKLLLKRMFMIIYVEVATIVASQQGKWCHLIFTNWLWCCVFKKRTHAEQISLIFGCQLNAIIRANSSFPIDKIVF